MMNLASCLYQGRVTHQRLIPFRHDLAYNVYALYVDLTETPALDRHSIWFGYNRFALLGFDESDHGARDGSSLINWVRTQLSNADLAHTGHSIRVLCFPRVLGYVFNPLTIYFCHDEMGRLGAVLYEVKNTFGEQHGYLFPITDSALRQHTHQCAKEFYVSPFIDMTADYHFTIAPPDESFNFFIRQTTKDGELLRAVWGGQRIAWSEQNLKRCFWQYPLLTFSIMFDIHWHGLKIWLKGRTFFGRPPLPENAVTVIKPSDR